MFMLCFDKLTGEHNNIKTLNIFRFVGDIFKYHTFH